MAPEQPRVRPDENGRFGKFGGKYVPETLMAALSQLEEQYSIIKDDAAFQVRKLSILKGFGHVPCLRFPSA
jgi:tryptophan synthase beta chain